MDIAQILINLIDSFMLSIMVSFIGEPFKKNKLKYSIIALLLFMYLMSLDLIFIEFTGTVIEGYISLLSIMFLYKIFFNKSIFDSAFHFLFGLILVGVVEMILGTIFFAFGMSIEYLFEHKNILVIFELLKLVFTVSFALFVNIRKPIRKAEGVMPYFITLAVNIFIFIQFMRILTNWINFDETVNYIYLYALFFTMLIINVSLIRYVSRSQKKLTQLETYDEYKKLIIPLIENSRAIEHDFNNHLLTLKGLAENGNIKEFNEYYDAINSAVKSNSVYKQCNNPVLGALMQEKHDFAKINNIDFDINIFEDSSFISNISSYHIITIVSNLIDNAFDEVMKIEPDSRKVSIEYREKDNLEITVKNSLSESIDGNIAGIKNDKKFSSKGTSRGYGLGNVKKIVREYNGELSIFHSDEDIHIMAVLSA